MKAGNVKHNMTTWNETASNATTAKLGLSNYSCICSSLCVKDVQ